MAWTEPLSVSTVDHDEYTFTVTVKAGNGVSVAHVKCAVNVPAAHGAFGAMFIDNASGGARQKIRALVLLTREALRHAGSLGIRTVNTTLPPRLQKFAETMAGKASVPSNASRELHGSLADMLAHAESIVQANGDVPALTIADVTL